MTEPILGVDIAKFKFNVCLINTNGKLKHKVFANTAAGFEQLSQWLSKRGVHRVSACMEATGLTATHSRSICMKQVTASASSIRRLSKLLPQAAFHAPKQRKWMRS